MIDLNEEDDDGIIDFDKEFNDDEISDEEPDSFDQEYQYRVFDLTADEDQNQ